MVRMVAPPVESAPDNEVPSRLDIEAQAHVDPRTTQRSSGWRRQLLLPLRYSYWGCGGPSARWGFEDSYPVMLRENLPQEDWQYAISRINAGYIGSVWPKIVWAPFFFFMVVGAIVEGAARTDDIATSPIPGGIAMAILTTTGLLTSLLLSKVSHALLKRDLRRIATTCSVLTEQFRENSVTFDLNIRHVGARMEARLDIKLHVPDVAIEHVILNVAEYTGVEDKHLVHIDSSGERTVVYSTDRTRPMRDLGAGVVHRYGFGTVESSDEESEEEDENGNPVMKRQKFLTPHGGFCGCKEETRLAAEGWHKATEGPHKTTIFVWRNQHFKSCHACKLPVFDRDAHWRATLNLDVRSLEGLPAPADIHLLPNHTNPNLPEIRPFECEEALCGQGWSAGMCSSCCLDWSTMCEACCCGGCLVAEMEVVLDGNHTVYDDFEKYCLICCCSGQPIIGTLIGARQVWLGWFLRVRVHERARVFVCHEQGVDL